MASIELEKIPLIAADHLAYISLGSNLGDSVAIIRQALESLREFSTQPLRRSSLWRTTPLECPAGSPPFVNAVAGLCPCPGEQPESLLEKLRELERVFGRRIKQVTNEPRPLDLDLLAFGHEVRQTASLQLPHPRAHLRRFVLEPLAEIAPDLVLPGQDRSVVEMLRKLPAQGMVEQLVL
jgi:2-amino-4-hydroxy-6-hydroxymethyldihydropteridine diphosphokinase